MSTAAPSPAPGWRSRGYLPHRDEYGLLQAVTFRLADSLPQEKLQALRHSLSTLPQTTQDLERRKQIEAWLDAGIGCCALRHPALATTVETALLHHDAQRYHLLAWCIMPNHVHVLLQPLTSLAGILQSWKSYTGRWARRAMPSWSSVFPGKASGCGNTGTATSATKHTLKT